MRGALLMMLLALAACAPSRQAMRDPVDDVVRRRLGESLQLQRVDDAEVAATVDRLLAQELTRDAAAQVALLQNPALQATYEELGVAEAQALQAALIGNPVVEGGVHFGHEAGGHDVDFEVGVEQDLLSLLFLPGRLGTASRALDATRARVAAAVIEMAARARAQHTRTTAALERLELRRTIAAATEASWVVAQRLHAAGNVRDLDVLREESNHRLALVALQEAEQSVVVERARLAAILGVFGPRAELKLPARMGPEPDAGLVVDDIEQRAVAQSLALTAERAELDAAAQRLGYMNVQRFLPRIDVGASLERDHGVYEAGPTLSIGIPLFDAGQGTTLALEAEVRRRGALWSAEAVSLRARAREAAVAAKQTAERARYLRDVVLPTQQRLLEAATRQYNAMELDTFTLLATRRQQTETAEQYVTQLRDAWLARTAVDALLAGGAPDAALAVTSSIASESSNPNIPASSAGGH